MHGPRQHSVNRQERWREVAYRRLAFFDSNERNSRRRGVRTSPPIAMDDLPSSEIGGSEKEHDSLDRRLFLRSLGKWSGAAIAAAGVCGARLSSAPEANAVVLINRGGPRRRATINPLGSRPPPRIIPFAPPPPPRTT